MPVPGRPANCVRCIYEKVARWARPVQWVARSTGADPGLGTRELMGAD